jgi:hypothetical protein
MIAHRRSRTDLLSVQRALSIADRSELPAVVPALEAFATELASGELHAALRACIGVLSAPELPERRLSSALAAAARCCQRLHHEARFAASPPVDDDGYSLFLRAALHEDGKLAGGQAISLNAIQRRAQCTTEVLHAAAARALEEEVAYAADDEQTYSIQVKDDDVNHALEELSRKRPTKRSVNVVPKRKDNSGRSHRWDETWHRLLVWTNGQGPSERLAHQVLLQDGYADLDPSHPLGGPDGGKDAICTKGGKKWVLAVYSRAASNPSPPSRRNYAETCAVSVRAAPTDLSS